MVIRTYYDIVIKIIILYDIKIIILYDIKIIILYDIHRCMFRFDNSVRLSTLDSFVVHPLTSSLLVDAPSSVKHHYSGTIYSTLSDTLLPLYQLHLPS